MNQYVVIGGAVIAGWLLFSGGWKPENIVGDLPIAPQNGPYAKRNLSEIDTIVVHHSLTRSDLPGSNPYAYAQFHTTSPNYMLPGIAYHIVIQPNGSVYLTNSLDTVAEHVGAMNRKSVGIVLSGNFDQEPFTDVQQKALVKAIKWVQRKVGKKLNLRGHYEYSNKTCPGANVRARLNQVAAQSGAIR